MGSHHILVATFQRRFGSMGEPELLRARFRRRERMAGENLARLATTLEREARRTYTNTAAREQESKPGSNLSKPWDRQARGQLDLARRTVRAGAATAAIHTDLPFPTRTPVSANPFMGSCKGHLKLVFQTLKYPSKSHPASGDHRHEKMRDSTDPTPPCKMLRRSDSPENKHSDNTGHGKAKTTHTHRVRERDGGTSYSPQENSHNHSSTLHSSSSNSHSSTPSSNPSKTSDATSRHNDSDYRLPRAETQCSAAPEQHNSKPVVLPAASAPSTVSSSPFTLLPGHQPKKSFAANGAATLSKLPPPTSSTPVQKSERKVPVSPVPQSPVPPLLQDPNLLRQLLPALQATLQLNNANVDMSKINEVLTAAVTQASLQSMLHKILTAGPSAFNITTLLSQAAQLSTQAQQSNQSPMSLTSDASSPRSYVSPRISTPQTNTNKSLINTPPVSSQPKVSTPVVKQGPAPQSVPQQPVPAEKHGHEPASPRTLQRSSSQRSPSPAPNHIPSNSTSSTASVPPSPSARQTCTFTPTLAAHFNENLIKHVQGWPADHVEKQRFIEKYHGTRYQPDSSRNLLTRVQDLTSSKELWFRAAVIAVPIAGGLILVLLIMLALRMLRSENKRLQDQRQQMLSRLHYNFHGHHTKKGQVAKLDLECMVPVTGHENCCMTCDKLRQSELHNDKLLSLVHWGIYSGHGKLEFV
ncbi:WW domain-containing adapter protein with coiled-coil [Acipenser ruthenus]|uniref:WW domain-containing adapter protein with coiled-coil n=1 Tax=Acipenser ruthenus TaxID=7906 RepID=A0A662YL10_ACIRT|nr:WW domain-containing adapter protein with coiled-coil [Acipenser ruthenus]